MDTTKSDVASENSPFGRQPQPVTLTFEGERQDIDYWMRLVGFLVSGQGDDHDAINRYQIRIYPHAVND